MKVNRILSLVLLFLTATLLLTSCVDTETPAPNPTPAADLIFSAAVTPEVVVAYGTTGEGMVADRIAARLRTLGMTVTTKAAADLTDGETCHILVGATGKPESAAVQEKIRTACGEGDLYWYLAVEGGKLVVLASGSEYYTKVLTALQEYETEDTLTVKNGTERKFIYTAAQQRADEEEKRRQEEEAKAKADAEKLAAQDKAWETRFDHITDPQIRTALERIYQLFDGEALARWFGSLYDPESGGFYYANSARDYEGFLPDMESTFQISFMIEQGMLGTAENLREFYGEELSARMIAFYQSMQDKDTGYFIHPQFGKEMTMKSVMRYSRDLNWATTMLKKLGGTPLYLTPYDRMKSTGAADTPKTVASLVGTAPYRTAPVLLAAAPAGWEPNKESVQAYVRNLMATTNSESWANVLASQSSLFAAAGVRGYVLDVLDETLNPEYGLWVQGRNADGTYTNPRGTTETPYGIFTVIYKLLNLYKAENDRPFPYVLKMQQSAIDCIKSEAYAIRVTYLYNPWATLAGLRTMARKKGTAEELAAFDAVMSQNAADLISSTLVNLGDFHREDGSFSFLPGKSSPNIYNTPVSLGLEEGDINGTLCGIGQMAEAICGALGSPLIPVFNYHHGQILLEAMKNATPVTKRRLPGKIYDYDMEGTDKNLPDGISFSGGTGGKWEYVADPDDPGNRVLRLVKDTEKNITSAITTIRLIDTIEMEEGQIIRTSLRFRLTGDTRYGNEITGSNANILQMRFSTGAGDLYMPVLRFNSDATGFYLTDAKSTGGGYVGYPMGQDTVLTRDTWYELTYEFHITGIGTDHSTFRAVIYLNGTRVGESGAFYSDSGKATADGGTVAFDLSGLTLSLHPQMRIHADILVDDIKTEIVTPAAD